MNFIKNALREFKHVVWPTREETKKYFLIVLSVLCAFGLYLFVVWNIFSEVLFGLKNMVNPASTTPADIQLPAWLEGLQVQTGSVDTTPIIPDVTWEDLVEVPAETVVETEEVAADPDLSGEAIVEETPAWDTTNTEAE